jgi:hypothetical protein
MKKEMNIFYNEGPERLFAVDRTDIHHAVQHFERNPLES